MELSNAKTAKAVCKAHAHDLQLCEPDGGSCPCHRPPGSKPCQGPKVVTQAEEKGRVSRLHIRNIKVMENDVTSVASGIDMETPRRILMDSGCFAFPISGPGTVRNGEGLPTSDLR